MTDATVADELTFEELPENIRALVQRLYDAGYFGENEKDLESDIERLEFQVDDLKSELYEAEDRIKALEEKLSDRYQEGYDVGYEEGYDVGYDAGKESIENE